MSERSCHNRSFQLGSWTIDPDESTIQGQGQFTRIDHKAMHVLGFLADHPERTVAREAIFDHVWPGTAVTDDVLTVAISTLRRALGDDAKNPSFIRTLPKRGYRLLVSPCANGKPQSSKTNPQPDRRRVRYTAMAAGLLLLPLSVVLYQSWKSEGNLDHPSIRSIVVLPFKDYSEAPTRQHIADGITEALTMRLAKTGNFAVTPRSTAERYGGSGQSHGQIGRELGVEAILEGSVQVSGGQFRLHAQLIDAQTERYVWAETYDRPLEDILRLQSELAVTVISRIEDRTVPAEEAPTVNPKAYDLYLKARYLRNQASPESVSGAVESLERSIELSPEYAKAHAALAEVLFLQVELGLLPADIGFSKGLESAERALALDPDLPEAHAAKAIAAFGLDWDFVEANQEFELALEGGDQNIVTLKWYVRYLVVMRRFKEAVEVAHRIQEIDPYSYVNLSHVHALSYSGRHEAALDRLREIQSLLPSAPGIHAAYAQIYMRLKRHDDAARSLLDYAEAAQWPAPLLEAIRETFATGGAEATYKYLASEGSPLTSAALRAKFHAMLGENEEALRLLQQSVSSRDMNVLWMDVDSSFDHLRSSARFRELVRELGLSSGGTG